MDATYFNHGKDCVFIALTDKKEIYYKFYNKENYINWKDFLSSFNKPKIVVADGQKGIKRAVFDVFEGCLFQRCLFHFVRNIEKRTTRNPNHYLLKEFHDLILNIKNIETKEEKDRWLLEYKFFKKIFYSTLVSVNRYKIDKQKEKKIKSCIYLTDKTIPFLFVYLFRRDIPNTTNHIEGGINAKIKKLLNEHKGLPALRQKVLISVFLEILSNKNRYKNS